MTISNTININYNLNNAILLNMYNLNTPLFLNAYYHHNHKRISNNLFRQPITPSSSSLIISSVVHIDSLFMQRAVSVPLPNCPDSSTDDYRIYDETSIPRNF